MDGKREVGTVKFYNPSQGRGVITLRKGKDIDVFHQEVERAGLKALQAGDWFSFSVSRRWEAQNLLNTTTSFRFDSNYLRAGYFDDKGQVRREIIDPLAVDVAKILGNQGMKAHQLRRFFSAARRIEARLRIKQFEAVKIDIDDLKAQVAYQVGRELVPNEFKQFIDRNAQLAGQDVKNFRQGYLRHFQSVVAYFVYYFQDMAE